MIQSRNMTRRSIHRLAKVATFTPTLLPGLKLWLSAGALGLHDGDPVPSWPDLSGRGNTATAAGGAPPQFRANAVNGLPAVALNGIANYFQLPFGDFQNMGSFGVYCVCSCTGPGQNNPRIFMNGPLLSGVTIFKGQGVQDLGILFGADSAHFLATTSAPLTAQFNLFGFGYNGTSIQITQGGVVIAGPLALGAPPTPSGPVAYLGGDAQPSAFAGAFAEVLVFLPGLAPAADQKLTAYLKTRYAIA